jgi:hypothetical protein
MSALTFAAASVRRFEGSIGVPSWPEARAFASTWPDGDRP